MSNPFNVCSDIQKCMVAHKIWPDQFVVDDYNAALDLQAWITTSATCFCSVASKWPPGGQPDSLFCNSFSGRCRSVKLLCNLL